MPYVPFATQSYEHKDFGLPPTELENWYAIEAPDFPDVPHLLVPTPGAALFATGVAAGRGVFQSDSLIGGDIIVAEGTDILRVNSSGTRTVIPGGIVASDSVVVFAASQTPQLVVNSGSRVYTIVGSAVTRIDMGFPGSLATNGVSDVVEMNQRHHYLETGTGRIHTSDVADAATVSATNFVTAESEPDSLLALMQIGNTIIAFGTASYELFYDTGDANAPLAPRRGGSVPQGIMARDAKTQINNVGFFVRADGAVCVIDANFSARAISTDPISRALSELSAANKAQVELSAYSFAGRAFLHLHIPGVGDQFYDIGNRRWHRRRQTAQTHYQYRYYVEAFGNLYAQATADGDLVKLSDSLFSDRGSAVRRVCNAVIPVPPTGLHVDSVIVAGQSGVALPGQVLGSAPEAMLRVARNGRTFGLEQSAPLGAIGEFDHIIHFGPQGYLKSGLGVARFEFAISDPVGVVIHGLHLNEPMA